MTSTGENRLLSYLTNTSNPANTELSKFMNAVAAQTGTKSLTDAEAILLTG
jgi:hypothetical protein